MAHIFDGKKLNNESHHSVKQKSAITKCNLLKSSGYFSKSKISSLKISQYKSYIRPSLLHGIENLSLNISEAKKNSNN